MKLPKLRELGIAIRALLTGPYTTKFPKVPHVPAKRFRGKPVPDAVSYTHLTLPTKA